MQLQWLGIAIGLEQVPAFYATATLLQLPLLIDPQENCSAGMRLLAACASDDALERSMCLQIFYQDVAAVFPQVCRAKAARCHSKAEHSHTLTNLLCSAAKFNGVHSIDLHIPSNFGADQTEIHFIGFKGEYSQVGLLNHASSLLCHLRSHQYRLLSKADWMPPASLGAPAQVWMTFAGGTCSPLRQ